MRHRSARLSERVRSLPMDEPPAPETAARARQLAAELGRFAGELRGEAAALALAGARALEAAADRQTLFVHVVPLTVAALDLLGRDRGGDPSWERGLAGARYDLETVLPGPVKPDVGLDSLRRGPKSGRRD